jgi:hypothetical protein
VTAALVFAGIIALVAIAFLSLGPARSWKMAAGNPDLGQFDIENPVRAKRPNDALLCTPGLCGNVRIDGELPEYDLQPPALMQQIDKAFATLGERLERVDDGSEPDLRRYVTWTPGLGFPDTNSFEAVSLANGKTGLVAHARAQIGYSDRGNNRRRLREVTRKLEAGD